MKKKIFLALVISMMSTLFTYKAHAGQDFVNNVVNTITRNVETKKWELAKANIVSLDKTLFNEIITSKNKISLTKNPIKEKLTKVQQRLKDIQAEYKIFNDAYTHYLKARKIKTKEAINDIGVEMINKLALINGGKLALITGASNNNSKIIASEIKAIKTLDAMGKYILQRRDSLIPAIREAQKDREELIKLNAQYESVVKKYVGLPASSVTQNRFQWVLKDVLEDDGSQKVTANNSKNPLIWQLEVDYSNTSVIFKQTYLGATDTSFKIHHIQGASISVKAQWNAPDKVIKSDGTASVELSVSLAGRSGQWPDMNGKVFAQIVAIDKDGKIGLELGVLENKDGNYWFETSGVNHYQSFSEKVSAKLPGGSKQGGKIGIKISSSNGGNGSVSTTYIYECESIDNTKQ